MSTHFNEYGQLLMEEGEAMDAFRDVIDETHPKVSLLGYEYSPADVLENYDPVAFRVSFSDYCDAQGIEPVSSELLDKLDLQEEQENE